MEDLEDRRAASGRYRGRRSVDAVSAVSAEQLMESKFFQGCDAIFVSQVVDFLQLEMFGEGQNIITQGEEGDKMYYLFRGKVSVLVGEAEIKVAELPQGSVFGEMALMGQPERTATIRAAEFCDCRSLNKTTLTMLLKKFSKEKAVFHQMAEERLKDLETKKLEKEKQEHQKRLSELPVLPPSAPKTADSRPHLRRRRSVRSSGASPDQDRSTTQLETNELASPKASPRPSPRPSISSVTEINDQAEMIADTNSVGSSLRGRRHLPVLPPLAKKESDALYGDGMRVQQIAPEVPKGQVYDSEVVDFTALELEQDYWDPTSHSTTSPLSGSRDHSLDSKRSNSVSSNRSIGMRRGRSYRPCAGGSRIGSKSPHGTQHRVLSPSQLTRSSENDAFREALREKLKGSNQELFLEIDEIKKAIPCQKYEKFAAANRGGGVSATRSLK